MRPDLSIIIPTFNEEENIQNTIQKISHTLRFTTTLFEIIVVDDSSTDKTQFVVTDLILRKYPVVLITRTKDPGLSQSVMAGFERAQGSVVVVTDADLSHDVTIIPQMYNEIKKNDTDIVIGSRYMPTGGIKDWPLKRRLISKGATFLGRLLFQKITDPISGFFATRRDLILHTQYINPRCGYKILLEILSKCHWDRVKELPYTFTNRKVGESKLKKSTIVQFIKQFIDNALFPGRGREEIRRIARFAVVGISGIAVNTIALVIFKEFLSAPLILASILAIEISILTNFILNDRWTFQEYHNNTWIRRVIIFNSVSVVGAIINIIVLTILSSIGVWYILGNFVGIGFAFVWNFMGNKKVTWVENSPKF
jgi:dolichol-phosphate mannosyltransferase